jgi:hypothetical protein
LIGVIERQSSVGCSDWLELKLIWYTWIAGSLNLLEPLERKVVYRGRNVTNGRKPSDGWRRCALAMDCRINNFDAGTK